MLGLFQLVRKGLFLLLGTFKFSARAVRTALSASISFSLRRIVRTVVPYLTPTVEASAITRKMLAKRSIIGSGSGKRFDTQHLRRFLDRRQFADQVNGSLHIGFSSFVCGHNQRDRASLNLGSTLLNNGRDADGVF